MNKAKEKLQYIFERKMWYKEAWTKNDISFYCRFITNN